MTATVTRVRIRPLTKDDVDAAEYVSGEASYALDAATQRIDWPPAARRDATRSALWRKRCLHLIEHDADGCWIAEDDSGPVGIATSLRRESWWGLSSYFVLPRAQGTGIGKALLDAALRHADGTDRGMICATHDPKAFRRYRRAGFTLHPTMLSWGTVDRSAIPALHRVRDGSAADVDWCDEVDRRTRGAGHGIDHELLRADYPLAVIDDAAGRGYCYLRPAGGAYLLAATDELTASELLWESLARASDRPELGFHFATAEQEWAVDVALAARLEIHGRCYVAYRGMRPAAPYLPSGHVM
jgi:GNAT superfamily N-acetyltransferase